MFRTCVAFSVTCCVSNGCEVATLTNLNHCGKCNNKCPAPSPPARTATALPSASLATPTATTTGRKTAERRSPREPTRSTVGPFARRISIRSRCPSATRASAGSCCATAATQIAMACWRMGVIEQNTFDNSMSCGSSGNVCPTYPNAVPLCANEFCGLCQDGFAYCYAPEIDQRGCSKIFFDRDVNNCGGCNVVCAAGQSCQQ